MFLFEAPKSVLQCESILRNNTAVAMFGMNLHKQQIVLLLELGVTKFNICLDKQYESMYNNDEFDRYKKIINDFITKLSPYGEVNVVYDTEGLLDYKDSPSDKGKDVFVKLYKQRERFT